MIRPASRFPRSPPSPMNTAASFAAAPSSGPDRGAPDRVGALAYRRVAWPSETGTPDEAAFADRLAGLLREIPVFRDNPDDVALVDSHAVPGGGMTRSVAALVRGSGRRT